MKTHLVINGVDYTPHIVDDSYDINSNDVYESWEDGNKVEHRIPVTKKKSLSFHLNYSRFFPYFLD